MNETMKKIFFIVFMIGLLYLLVCCVYWFGVFIGLVWLFRFIVFI
jgi:hypothetical protein